MGTPLYANRGVVFMQRSYRPRAQDCFKPRLVHLREGYAQTPGLMVVDWRDGKLSWKQKILRCILYKVKQGRSSPLGMSKLPFELLEVIFRELCGMEMHAVRLACVEWEWASRPFFAERHLRRSLIWLTASDLRRLERLARRFGPYMRDICIAKDHFTISGLRQVWRRYKQHRDYLNDLAESVSKHGAQGLLKQPSINDEQGEIETQLIGFIHQPLRNKNKPGNEYFRHAYQQRQPLSPWKTNLNILDIHSSLWQFLCNTITQTLLRLTGQDRRSLARIAEMMPNGRLEAVQVSYAAEGLNGNVQVLGRAAPGFAYELALLCGECGQGEVLRDGEFGEYVRKVVGEVMDGRVVRAGGRG